MTEQPPDLSRRQQARGEEFTRLLDMATPEMFRTNAFRITGLPVDATTREISRHADKLKMMEELGQGESVHTSAFAVHPPPSVDQIRDAIQRLRDPETRLIDEFFWFWPEEFGKGRQDAAVQALANGDRDAALETWLQKESDPAAGTTAMHNVAVVWQLVALEWEEYAAHQTVDDERRKKIEGYWRDSFKRWDLLLADDHFWDCLSARIKQLDEHRLTGGVVRRMRKTLPQALQKINAALAVQYVEKGRLDLARIHVQFMREAAFGDDDLHAAADLVLAPVKARLKQHLEQARSDASVPAGELPKAIRELLDHASRARGFFELFFSKGGTEWGDLSDKVAEVTNQLQLKYHKATDDQQSCLAMLRAIKPFAVSDELIRLIDSNIAVVTNNLAFARFEPYFKALRDLDQEPLPPKAKLARIRQSIWPRYSQLHAAGELKSPAGIEFVDRLANSLRTISVSAHNEHEDMATAMEAIEWAEGICRTAEFKVRLQGDKEQLERNRTLYLKHNLSLKIRGDHIEVTRELFRLNSRAIQARDIHGLRFGIYKHYTNGIRDHCSYSIVVGSSSHRAIRLECKRLFRREQKTAADYQAIVEALYYQIVPGLCTRIAERVAIGSQMDFGDCVLSAQGLHATTGALFWKKKHLIPWSAVRYATANGYLRLTSASNPKFLKVFSLRDCWNAVIFKEIAVAIVTQLKKART